MGKKGKNPHAEAGREGRGKQTADWERGRGQAHTRSAPAGSRPSATPQIDMRHGQRHADKARMRVI